MWPGACAVTYLELIYICKILKETTYVKDGHLQVVQERFKQ